MTQGPYADLAARLAPLDRRHLRYRFDLEADVPWADLDAPGRHAPDALLAGLGVDADGLDEGARARLDDAWALAACGAFAALERVILRFCAAEAPALGEARSLTLLVEEEEKHVALFERYAAWLRRRRPDLATAFDAAWPEAEAALLRLDDPAALGPAAHHALFWLTTTFFEELTVWIADVLDRAPDVRPTWRAVHALHRREEVQHLATDAACLDALGITPAERDRAAKAFLLRLEAALDLLTGVAPALAAAGAPAPPRRPLREHPFGRALARDPAFRRTRAAIPGLADLAGIERPDGPDGLEAPRAHLRGGPAPAPRFAALPDALRAAAEAAGSVTWVEDDGEHVEPYADLVRRAGALLAGLRAEGARAGDVVALLLDRPRDLSGAFWACLAGGLVPAPLGVSPLAGATRGDDDAARVAGALEALGRPRVVVAPGLRGLLPDGAPARTPDELAIADADPAWTPSASDAPAFVQPSSGSTGAPRPIVLTHRNVLTDLEAARAVLGVGPDDVVVSWLPLFHDLGLAYHLTPVLAGARQVVLSPARFARQPLAWLEALSRHRATHTAAPPFGLSHALRRLTPQRAAALDLRALRACLVGAEPVPPALLRRFAAALHPAGLDAGALRPAYGLAEATVAVTIAPGLTVHALDRAGLDEGPLAEDDPRAVILAGAGPPVPGVEVQVRGPDGAVVAEGVVGDVLVRGPNVTPGLLGGPSLTDAEGWLPTGDRGLVRAGELVVTGRARDTVRAHGRSFAPGDLEAVVGSVEGVAEGRVAVVNALDPALGPDGGAPEQDASGPRGAHVESLDGRPIVAARPASGSRRTHHTDGLERVVPVLRVDARARRAPADVARAVAARLAAVTGAPVPRVLLLRGGDLPRTTSGKPRRAALRAALEAGTLDADAIDVTVVSGAPPAANSDDAWLDAVRRVWAEALDLAPEAVPADASFVALGGDSLRAVDVHGRLEALAGRRLDLRLLREDATAREVAAALADAPAPAAPAARTSPVAERDVAIVAMAARLPGAADLEGFWRLVRDGGSAIGPVPPDRWDVRAYSDPDAAHAPGEAPRPGTTPCAAGAFLGDVRGFEPEAFGLDPDAAADLDPQQRLFLEVAADALARAGLRTVRVGVFAGTGQNLYAQRRTVDPAAITASAGPANLEHMTAARVAALLGLTGPAFTLDAACATSLVAVLLACRSVVAGECDAAVAGGVELGLDPRTWVLFGQAGVLSPRGRCQPFSAQADGFVPGEGVAAVVVRPLAAALADDDPILAVVKGGAINNDGGGLSDLAPNPAGQRDVLVRAWADAGLPPASAGYVEAHGAGTPVGDAVEARALLEVFAEAPDLALGSVKSAVGHLLHAAGVASLVKAVLALAHGELPASPDRPDPRLGLEQGPFRLLPRAAPWTRRPRRAGVSAFGIGGTNCHVVLEEAPARAPSSAPARDAHLCVLAAHDDAALARLGRAAAAALDDDVGRLAATVNLGARRGSRRRALVVPDDPAAARRALADVGPGAARVGRPRVAFVLPGPGTQTVGMGRHLRDEPGFARGLLEADRALRPHVGRSVAALIAEEPPPGQPPAFDRIELTQPVVFAFGLALARWLEDLGVRPDAVLGHSAGEYVAAVLAGALDLDEAARLVTRRGQRMAEAPAGRMAAVLAPEGRVRPHLQGGVTIACLNEDDQVVVSGEAAGVEALSRALERDGVVVRPLPIGCAAHSPLMREAMTAFARDAEGVTLRPPRLAYYSSLVGARVSAFDRDYLVDHLRAPVRFAAAVRAALSDGVRCFVELSATAALVPCVERVAEVALAPLAGPGVVAVSLCRRSRPGWAPTLEALGALVEAGVDVDLRPLDRGRRRAPLPLAFPWARRPLWRDPPAAVVEAAPAREHVLDLATTPAVRDHQVHGEPTAPAALLLDLALGAVAARGRAGLDDVVIGRPLALEAGARRVRVRVGDDLALETAPHFRADVGADPGDDDGAWTTHLTARPRRLRRADDAAAPRLDLGAIEARCPVPVDVEDLLAGLRAGGLVHGPSLRTLVAARRGEGEALARLSPAEHGAARRPGGRLDAGLVDGALQALAALLPAGAAGTTYLGFAMGRVTLLHDVDGPCVVHARLRALPAPDASAEVVRADVTIAGDCGAPRLVLEDVTLKRHRAPAPPGPRLWAVEATPVAERAAPVTLPPSQVVVVLGPAGSLRLAVERQVEAAGATALPEAPARDDAGWDALAARLVDPAPDARERRAFVLVDPDVEALGGLAAGLARRGVDALGGLVVVGRDAACVGFARALDRERPAWGVRALHVVGEAGPSDALARRAVRALARPPARLVTELHPAPHAVELRPLDPPAAPRLAGGTWWITGGLGGVGLAVAERLARAGARLLLTGRRAEADASALERLRASGGEPLYAPADVTDREALRAALDLARARWGDRARLDGVVHAAGVLREGPIERRTRAGAAAVLGPKVEGARAVLALAGDAGAPVVLLCSSLAGLFGVPGQTDYAAANAALDGLARSCTPGGPRVVSALMGPWREVGMVKDRLAGLEAQGLVPLAPEAGAAALLAALDAGAPRVVVAEVAAARARDLVAALDRPAAGAPEDDAPAAPAPATGGPLAAFVVERLAAHLRCDPARVDPTAPFPALGVDSLMAVTLVRELERRFALRLHPTLLFELRTVAELVAHVEARHGPALASALAPRATATPRAAPQAGGVRCAAWVVEGGGLVATTVEVGPPGPGEVEVEARAVGVNFIDLLAASGMHPTIADVRFVPGHEVAGVITRVGQGVSQLAPGERVVALAPRGAFSRRVVVPAAATRPIPDGTNDADAAGVLIAGLTAIACVETKGRVARGERVLVQAAAGATGLACVQLALHHGAEVLGTASAPEKLARLRAMGVTHAIDYRAEPFDEAVRRLTRGSGGGEGVDVVIDSLSGDALARGLALLRPGGRLVEIGAAGVVAPPPVDPRRLFLQDQDLVTVNVARLGDRPPELARALARLAELVAAGVLRAQVGHALPFEAAPEALRLLRERRNLGKVVLIVDPEPTDATGGTTP